MKRTFVKTAGKKFITAAAIVAALSFGALKANATDTPSKVEYTGVVNDKATFNVQYANESGAAFNVNVKNDAGEIIFSHRYNDKNFNKKFVIENLPEDGSVTFVISGANAGTTETFNINTATKMTSDIVVTKAK